MAWVQNVLIMGAAGKDFHVFNAIYRGRDDVCVRAFTATQIPGIEGRRYPPELCGPGYPEGIPIEPEGDLTSLIDDLDIHHVVFAYSDVSYAYVEAIRARVTACGATFETPPTSDVMLASSRPVIAVCAVRTGCGKSQTTRHVARILSEMGKRGVAIRHPMPYGDLVKQAVQRFASLDDLARHECTIEEMKEYEPHIHNGFVVYAGVDYEAILREAEKEADVILWDGGNNDVSFYRSDLTITIVDPHRPGDEVAYYPGRENLEMADVVLFNKMDSADPEAVRQVEANVRAHNPDADVVYANSPLTVADPSLIAGKRVLVIEDGPTLTHGGMAYGAGVLAARRHGAAELVDPRPYLVGTLAETFARYPDIGPLLPAMGYGACQVADLEATIAACDCDTVVIGTPIDLTRVVSIAKPHTRVTYELEETSEHRLEHAIRRVLDGAPNAGGRTRQGTPADERGERPRMNAGNARG